MGMISQRENALNIYSFLCYWHGQYNSMHNGNSCTEDYGTIQFIVAKTVSKQWTVNKFQMSRVLGAFSILRNFYS